MKLIFGAEIVCSFSIQKNNKNFISALLLLIKFHAGYFIYNKYYTVYTIIVVPIGNQSIATNIFSFKIQHMIQENLGLS